MRDYVVRAVSRDGHIRAFAAVTKDLVQEAVHRHQTFPVATAALGRTLSMGAILSCTCKNEEEVVTLRVEGNGPLGKILVDANGRGGVRGMVDHPQIELPHHSNGKLNVSGAVGEGMLHVIRDIGLKEPYHGSSPLVSGELAEDFTYYFTTSEQIPSSVGLGVLVQREVVLASGGYLLQVLPGADDETISEIEKNISQLEAITSFFAQGATPEELLSKLLGDQVDFLETQDVAFVCTCSHERVQQMLQNLGSRELTTIIEEQGEAEVICHFCNEAYHFDRHQLMALIAAD